MPRADADRPTTVAEYLRPAGRLRLIAHRGVSARFPENTLAAFEAAVAAAPDLIELDVTLSKDGVPVVLHDATLDRTTDGHGPALERSLAELERLDAGRWFDARFAGERIPTLAAALERIGDRVPVNVELKEEAGDALVRPVVEVVRAAGAEDRVVLSCFEPARLRLAREVAPEIARSSLFARRIHRRRPPGEILAEVGAIQLSPSRREVTEEMVAACRALGRPVAVYTVNDPVEARALRAIGVHAVFTDDVETLRRGLEEA
ncbi:MAG: glycerophosphodiester phosphodiesterase [Planctomycetota bacterium JB042]